MNLFKNKRGSILDVLLVGVVLFVFAVSALLGLMVTNKFMSKVSDMSGNPMLNSTQASSAGASLESMYPGVIDGSVLFLCVGMFIVAIILAGMVRIHPIFIAIAIIAWIIMIIICAALSNTYEKVALDPQMSQYADKMMFTTTILGILPWIIAIFGAIIMIVMYKSWSNSQ